MSPEAASILAGALQASASTLAGAVVTATVIIAAAALAKPVVTGTLLRIADHFLE